VLKTDSARSRRIGIGLTVLGTICFSIIDGSGKWLVQQPAGGRGGVAALCHPRAVDGAAAGAAPGPGHRAHEEPQLQALRAVMMAAMTALNFWALQYLQLAETGAIQFSVPVLIALMSAWWLGERLDARRWVAIIAGFLGVLLVIRPGRRPSTRRSC
jgi:drug/metabolite transporter (DMT)-like permease